MKVKIFKDIKDMWKYYGKNTILGVCCPYERYNTKGNKTLEIGEILLSEPIRESVVVHELFHAAMHFCKERHDLSLLGFPQKDFDRHYSMIEKSMEVEEIVAKTLGLLYIDFKRKYLKEYE